MVECFELYPAWTWTDLLYPAHRRQDVPTSGYYLKNMDFFTRFHGKKLKWKNIK
jgi:hypothetical protein